MSSTHNIQQKTILKYEGSRDGILAWHELKNDFAYDGSKELRLVVLENMTQVAYSDTVPGGLVAYLDSFQAQVAELITIDLREYSDYRLKRLLLGNVQSIEGIQHLVQNCRDDDCKTYKQCGSYLRKNSILIDSMKAKRTPVRLMNVQDDLPKPISYDTAEKVTQLFHSVASIEGVYPTYRMFSLKTYRESCSIPDKIWAELEPMFKKKINEIRAKVRK
jgi:hypothetical protein